MRLKQRLRSFFGGSTAIVGAAITAWQAVAVWFLLTLRVEAGDDQPPLGLTVALLSLGLFMLVGGYWARRDS